MTNLGFWLLHSSHQTACCSQSAWNLLNFMGSIQTALLTVLVHGRHTQTKQDFPWIIQPISLKHIRFPCNVNMYHLRQRTSFLWLCQLSRTVVLLGTTVTVQLISRTSTEEAIILNAINKVLGHHSNLIFLHPLCTQCSLPAQNQSMLFKRGINQGKQDVFTINLNL